MNKKKKIIIGVCAILCVCLIGITIFVVTKPRHNDDGHGNGNGAVTISTSRVYDDTTDATHAVYLHSFAYTDVATSGDNVVVSKDKGGFNFECHGLTSNKSLYVFVDGDIDNVADEFNIKTNKSVYSNKVMLDDSFLGEGEHSVQFVQFDGPDVIFCKTRHYKVEK